MFQCSNVTFSIIKNVKVSADEVFLIRVMQLAPVAEQCSRLDMAGLVQLPAGEYQQLKLVPVLSIHKL